MSTLRFIPLDASESAVLKDSRSLLPLDVYKKKLLSLFGRR